MKELLFEIYSEEIPAKMQTKAALQLERNFKELCDKENLQYQGLNVYITPCRMTLYLENIRYIDENMILEKRGPRADAASNIINAFAKSNKVEVEELVIKETLKGNFYFLIEKNIEISNLIIKILEQIIINFDWPKSMKWSENFPKWVRPIRNILCIYDEKILKLKFGKIEANNITYGHKIIAHNKIEVKDFSEYSKKLEENYVIFDPIRRKNIIIAKVNEVAEKHNVIIPLDENLLDEVCGLVEWPDIIYAEFDEKFLKLPHEILITSMKNHQKYFPVYNLDKSLINKFIIIINNFENENIRYGNEKVIRARLNDAEFFWQKDISISYKEYSNKLKNLIFYNGLGNMYQKTGRLTKIADFIAVKLDFPRENVYNAAEFSKIDLSTQLVAEFPELQGIIGYHFLLTQNIEEKIAIVAKNHYKPINIKDDIPADKLSSIISLADKIDNLVSLFFIGERATSSKDPYGLRRSAISILRLIIENKFNMNLKEIIIYATELCQEQFNNNSLIYIPDAVEEFLIDKLINYLSPIKSNIIKSVKGENSDFNLYHIYKISLEINNILSSDQGKILRNNYLRINNILEGEFNNPIDEKLLDANSEKNLFNTICEMDKLFKEKDIIQKIEHLVSIQYIIADFFDNVLINIDDNKLKLNRQILLGTLKKIFDSVLNFDQLFKEK